MTTNVLPDIDYSKLEELRKRLPSLADVELNPPKMDEVGKRAEQAVDRLLGRRRTPTWVRMVAGIGVIAIIGLLAAWFTWNRRPAWDASPEIGSEGSGIGSEPSGVTGFGAADAESATGTAAGMTAGDATWGAPTTTEGLTAAEASLTSNREPDERM